jgi:hypothetical protein
MATKRIGLPIGENKIETLQCARIIGQGTDIVAIRATSFNVIPDIPVLGSAGALTAMLLSLGLFLYRKRASTKTTTF